MRNTNPGHSPDPLGTLVIAGHSYPVTRIAFARGGLEVTAEAIAQQNLTQLDAAPVTIFGADGSGVDQGGTVSIPAARRGQNICVELFCSWDGTVNAGVLPELPQLPNPA